MRLLAATRSEMIKQFSTSVWWILLIVLVLYVGGTAGSIAAVFGAADAGYLPGGAMMPGFGADLAPLVYGLATSVGYVFPLIVGTLLTTGEFRHQTLTPTFLATPRRGVALGAKVVAGLVMGLVYGVTAVASTVGVGAGALALFGVETHLGEPETWASIGRMLAALVIWVWVGIGLGALIRNQIGAVVGVLAFTQFVEPIARLSAGFVDGLDETVQYLPGAASDALAGDSVFTVMAGGTVGQLEWWAGGLVLIGYAFVLLVLGYVASWRRDVA